MLRHISCALSVAAIASLLTLTSPANATEVHRYFALRRSLNADLRLTLATVQSDPSHYVGQVFELKGRVNAKADIGNGLLVSLDTSDATSAPMLEIPAKERSLFDGQEMPIVRVLVRVGEGASGNVAPLKVLAVTQEGEAALLDREEAARAAVIARQTALERQRRQRAAQIIAASGRRGSTASRGGFMRGPRATDGDAHTQAAYYQPQLDARAQNCFVPYFDFIARFNPRLDAPTVGQITFNLLRYSAQHEVDPRLVVAMIIAESEFDPRSTSHSGAMGLGQLMPETARDLGLTNPYDIEQNLYGAIRWLKDRLNDFAAYANADGSISSEQLRLAMAAYNAGLGAVRKYHGVPPYRATQAYVRRVESLFNQLCHNPR